MLLSCRVTIDTADGRIAVSLGSVVMIYYPRFWGRQRYAFAAYTAPCPPPDESLLDLQRYPGKVHMPLKTLKPSVGSKAAPVYNLHGLNRFYEGIDL